MAENIHIEYRNVFFNPLLIKYKAVVSGGLRVIEPFKPPSVGPPVPTPYVAVPYVLGTDGNLTEPSDAYSSTEWLFVPYLSLQLDSDYSIDLAVGNYRWQYTKGSGDDAREWSGYNVGDTYGAIKFQVQSVSDAIWDNFRGYASAVETPNNKFGDYDPITSRMRSQNGFKKFYLPKTNDGTIDGGWFGFYHHNAAIKNAIGGTKDAVEIATNHSIYTDGNVGTNAELVVRWDGMVGPAGQGADVESWEECEVDTAYAPTMPSSINKKRLWLDFADIDSMDLTSADNISAIRDKFGHFDNANYGQSINSRRPAAILDQPDNKSYAEFRNDTEEDRMSSDTSIHYLDNEQNSYHVFAVVRSTSEDGTIISKLNASTNKREWMLRTNEFVVCASKNELLTSEKAAAYKATVLGTPLDTDVIAMYEGIWRPGIRTTMFLNGVEKVRASGPAVSIASDTAWNKIGVNGDSANGLRGDIFDIKIYVNLTHAEILWVRQNYLDKFDEISQTGVAMNYDIGDILE